MKPSGNIASLIERFFTDRLMRQRNVSSNTIASYRDTFRLLFTFAQTQLHKPPSALALENLDASFISAFLNDLEIKRGASVRTRNLRLTAIRPPTARIFNASLRSRPSVTISVRYNS
jgi:site-specific recombinase XerD